MKLYDTRIVEDVLYEKRKVVSSGVRPLRQWRPLRCRRGRSRAIDRRRRARRVSPHPDTLQPSSANAPLPIHTRQNVHRATGARRLHSPPFNLAPMTF